MIAFAAVLALAAAMAWIAVKGVPLRIRIYLRFACALYAALAAGAAANFAPEAAADIVAPLAVSTLTIAAYTTFRGMPSPLWASLALAAACLAGLWSAANAQSTPSDVVLSLCLIAMFAIAKRGVFRGQASSIYLALGALAFLAALCARLANERASFMALLLFSAAGLLGSVLAQARRSYFFLKKRRKAQGRVAIRRIR
ncbi:MAG: hypothetical protein WCA81_05040 [Rhizomicrobium sp.]